MSRLFTTRFLVISSLTSVVSVFAIPKTNQATNKNVCASHGMVLPSSDMDIIWPGGQTKAYNAAIEQVLCDAGWTALKMGNSISCFKSIGAGVPSSAAAACNALGASLPVPQNDEENLELEVIMKQLLPQSTNMIVGPHQFGRVITLGLTKSTSSWVDIYNTIQTYFDWELGQPTGGNQHWILHRDLSQGFKCMAEMINRMMYLVIIFILTSVFAYFVLANFPFGLRKDRIKRLDLENLCGL